MYQGGIDIINVWAHLTEGNVKAAAECVINSKLNVHIVVAQYIEVLEKQLIERNVNRNQRQIRNIKISVQRLQRNLMRRSGSYTQGNVERTFVRIARTLERYKYNILFLPDMSFTKDTWEKKVDEEHFKKVHEQYNNGDKVALLLEQGDRKNISIYKVVRHLELALNQINLWPALLVWKGEEVVFVPIRSNEEIESVYRIIQNESDSFKRLREKVDTIGNKNLQLIHISDLHCGAIEVEQNKEYLLERLLAHIRPNTVNKDVRMIISGDCLEHPTSHSYKIYQKFLNQFEQLPIEVYTVLGNHDTTYSGIKGLQPDEAQIITEEVASGDVVIHKIQEHRIILILFNSNNGGMLAQGEIGNKQLKKVEEYLKEVERVEEYVLMGVLHHHPIPIQIPEWYAGEWYENLFPKFYEGTLKLVNSDEFMSWCRENRVRLLLHGHRHIPNFNQQNSLNIIGSGSSTGRIKHVDENKTYITYNVINYDTQEKKFLNLIEWYEEILGSGFKNGMIHLQIDK